MLRIGITGGIGSGKSTVADSFARLGIPVIDSDVIARSLLNPGTHSYAETIRIFGKDILKNNLIDREKLRKKIFSDKESRNRLEQLLHPQVRKIILEETGKINAPYCIIVVPLLIEAGFLDLVDRVLVVNTNNSTRIDRIQARDAMSTEEINNIIQSQSTTSEKLGYANDVVDNNGDQEMVKRQVEELHGKYLRLSQDFHK